MIYSPQVARKRMEGSPQMHARLESWLARRGRLLYTRETRESTMRLYALEAPAVAADVTNAAGAIGR